MQGFKKSFAARLALLELRHLNKIMSILKNSKCCDALMDWTEVCSACGEHSEPAQEEEMPEAEEDSPVPMGKLFLETTLAL